MMCVYTPGLKEARGYRGYTRGRLYTHMDPTLMNQVERDLEKRAKAREYLNAYRAANPELVRAQKERALARAKERGATTTTTIEQRRMYRHTYRAAHPEVMKAQKARARARAKERRELALALVAPPPDSASEGA